MASVFTQGNARFSYDGVLRMAVDTSTIGTTLSFPYESVRITSGDNASIASVVDASQVPHIKALGVVMGTIQVSGILMPDRGFNTFLSTAFGSRTNALLTPWIINLLPYNGGTVSKYAAVYFNRVSMSGAFSTRGDGMIIRWSTSGLILDPNNTLSAPTLTAAATEGLQGAGPASMANFSLSNGAASSPTIYDQVRNFGFSLDNGFVVQPWIRDTVNRIAGGCTPSEIAGSLSCTQLNGATNAIPQASGNYPLSLVIPTGDGTHTLTINTSMSWDSRATQVMPNDFYQSGAAFTLYGGSSTNGTSSFPVVANYV